MQNFQENFIVFIYFIYIYIATGLYLSNFFFDMSMHICYKNGPR